MLVLVAALSASASAAPPELKLTGTDKAAAGTLIVVSAETTAKAVKWKVVGDASVQQDSGGRKVFLVGKGRVTVLAVAASEAGELSEFAEWSADLGGVEPVVPPEPEPEAPAALVGMIQAAYIADKSPDKAAELKAFGDAMAAAAKQAGDPALKTAGALESAVRAATVARVGAMKLPAVGVTVGDYLSGFLPTDKDATLTAEDRKKAASGYKAVAAAVRRIK